MNQCIINNVHGSNFGNLMIKYMCANKIKNRAGNCVLSGYDMPYWNIYNPTITQDQHKKYNFTDDQHINIDYAAYLAKNNIFSWLNLHGHYQRMENFDSIEETNLLFINDKNHTCFGDDFIVCPIRGEETLQAIHSGYTLLPINFYEEVIKLSGLTPVFMGQTKSNIYTDTLRGFFPNGIFLPPQGALQDFEIIRHSRNIVVSISTFVWLAAWLSNAAKIIFPIFGLFNPDQFPDHNLIPLGDKRYKFYKFPIHHAVPVQDFKSAHAAIDRSWTKVGEESIF